MKAIGILEGDASQQFSDAVEKWCLALGTNMEYVPILFGSEDSDEMLNMMLELEMKGGDAYPPPEQVFEHTDAEITMGQFAPYGVRFMDALPNLRMIGLLRAGLENVDLEEATKRGIAVVNAAGRNANAVSDFTVGLMLAEARSIARSHHDIMQGNWIVHYPTYDDMPDMFEKTVGLFGFGYIGRLVAEKLSGFHVNVLVHDPFVSDDDVRACGAEPVSKDELFSKSDFISVHARLTEETRHSISAEDIARMKPSAYFINCARAGLVDYDALIDALQNYRIAGAALDVYYEEPLEPSSPFLKMDNVTLTPHVAGVTLDANTGSARIASGHLASIVDGKPCPGLMNPEVLNNEIFTAWLADAASRMGR